MASVPENDMSQICVAGFSARELPRQYLGVVSTGRYLLLPYPCAQLYLYKEGPSFLTPRCRAPRRQGSWMQAELAAVDTIDTWRQWVVMWDGDAGRSPASDPRDRRRRADPDARTSRPVP
jgi:hypothetical protein